MSYQITNNKNSNKSEFVLESSTIATTTVEYVNAQKEKLTLLVHKYYDGYVIDGLFSTSSSFYEKLPKSINLPKGYGEFENKSTFFPIIPENNKLNFECDLNLIWGYVTSNILIIRIFYHIKIR